MPGPGQKRKESQRNRRRRYPATVALDKHPPGPFQPLERPRAFEGILLQIEQAIADGNLKPGDRLPSEREFAETFGVSRASVREALRVLEMFGVVVARRGGGGDAGSIVSAGAETGLVSALRLHSSLLRIPTSDLVEIRVLIESYAAGHAARLARTNEAERLWTLIEAMRAADLPEHFHSLDTDFHIELGTMSHNALMPVLMEALRGSMEREMLQAFERLTDWRTEREKLISEHMAIATAVESGDSTLAEETIRNHIKRFYDSTMS